jgi:type IV secretion system protein PtlA
MKSKTVLSVGFVAAMVLCLLPEVALAGGGLQKVEGVLNNVVSWLGHIAAVVCTIVVIFKGFQIWFGRATWSDAGQVILGCLAIAGAAEIALWFFG